MDGRTDTRTHQHTDIGMDAHMNGLTLERTNAQKDRRTDRRIHAQRDVLTHERTYRHTNIGMDANMNGRTLERTNRPTAALIHGLAYI